MISVLLTAVTALQFPNSTTTIWTTAPASHFIESSVLGNGRIGAMVFGGTTRDRVVLNESGMWSGSAQDADREDAHRILPELRRLFFTGDNAAAQDLMMKSFVCKGPGSAGRRYGCYQTFGDLIVESPARKVTEYRRVLDLDRAVATTTFRSGKIQFSKTAFVSAPAQVFVYRYWASQPGAISFQATLSRPERAKTSIDKKIFSSPANSTAARPKSRALRSAGVCGWSRRAAMS